MVFLNSTRSAVHLSAAKWHCRSRIEDGPLISTMVSVKKAYFSTTSKRLWIAPDEYLGAVADRSIVKVPTLDRLVNFRISLIEAKYTNLFVKYCSDMNLCNYSQSQSWTGKILSI